MTIAEIMEAVKELKVMELSELVKALEEEFGVSATPVAVAGAVAGGDGAAAADAKTDFDVVLVDAGSSKINVIKLFARSPAWAWLRLRAWSRALPRL